MVVGGLDTACIVQHPDDWHLNGLSLISAVSHILIKPTSPRLDRAPGSPYKIIRIGFLNSPPPDDVRVNCITVFCQQRILLAAKEQALESTPQLV